MKEKFLFYCGRLHVSRQAFNKYLKTKDTSWKYQSLADAMMDICNEDECNDTYGESVCIQALQLKQSKLEYRELFTGVMKEIRLNHKPKT
ncbi:MAG: hypothetical protein V8S38_11710 [Lachnospiraceae bacterium]